MNPYTSFYNKILALYLKYNLQWPALIDLMTLLNEFPNSSHQSPNTKHQIIQALPLLRYDEYVDCLTCKGTVCIPADSKNCPNCDKELALKDRFIYINLEPQIKKEILRHWECIHNPAHPSENITDVKDGLLYNRKSTNWLPMKLNSDGFQIYNSVSQSVWVILIQQDYLPPETRFLKENILTAGLYFGKKPDMKKLPLVNEAFDLFHNGVSVVKNGVTHHFYPNIISSSADLPAKYAMANMMQHNAYFACTYCLQPGEAIQLSKSKMVRYPLLSEAPPLRTVAGTHDLMLKAEGKKEAYKGVKGVSCLIGLPEFDIIEGFNLDYMHLICLGVFRRIILLWIESKNHGEPYYIPKPRQRIFSQRLLSMRPCSFVGRKPQSLDDIAFFKASEFRSLLIYFLPCEYGLVEKKYLDHCRHRSTHCLVQASAHNRCRVLAQI